MKLKLKHLVEVAGLFFAVTSGAAAQESPICSMDTAEAATVAAIAAEPERYRGRCVRVDGIRDGTHFYHNITAVYTRERLYGDPASSGGTIGIDSRNRGAPAQWVRVVGWVDDCSARQQRLQTAAPANEIIMLSGYCHYFPGPVLSVVDEQVLNTAPPVRLVRGWADPAPGHLAPMADGPAQGRFAAMGARIFALFESEDRAALVAALLPNAGGTQRTDAEATELADYLLSITSPLQAMRGQDLLVEVLGWREPLWADADWRAERTANPGPPTAIVCLAGSPRDAGFMPLSERDAHMLPGRPYGCMRMEIGSDDRVVIEIDRNAHALAEPPAR